MTRLSNSLLEGLYKDKILPNFDISLKELRWDGHSDVNSDASIHFFQVSSGSYILLSEDYPLLSELELTGWVRSSQQLTPIGVKNNNQEYIFDFFPEKTSDYDKRIIGSYRLYKVV